MGAKLLVNDGFEIREIVFDNLPNPYEIDLLVNVRGRCFGSRISHARESPGAGA
jgi:hypothetical protein